MQPILCALAAAVLFGAALVTTYSALQHMDALSGVRVSVPTAALLFWLASPLQDPSPFHDPSGGQGPAAAVFALVGVFFPAVVTLLTFAANQRLGPTVTGSIGSTAPLFAVLGAALFLGEPLGIREVAATAVIILGVRSLVRAGRAGAEVALRAASWLPWSAAALRGAAQLLSRFGLLLWPSPFAATLIGYSVSAIVVWAVPALGRGRGGFAINPRGAAWFAATGALNGAAVLLMYHALSSAPVYLIAPIVATYPLFALVSSALVLRREPLNAARIAGVGLIVGGVVLLLAH